MSGTLECNNPPACPRVFETDRGTVVVQGYVVEEASRPFPATPPAGETQVEMPREVFLGLARWVLAHGDELPEVPSILGEWQRTLFRLETRQQYLVEQEREQLTAFREGRPLPPSPPESQRWLRHLEEDVRAGRRWQRVHVVDQPLTDYLRFELDAYRGPAALGYETLVADRSRHPELSAQTEDFYLLDGEEENAFSVLMRYDEEGHFLGMWRTADPGVVAECRRQRDLALRYAEPLEEFMARLEPPLRSTR
jgi:hypothetical protein